MDFWRRSAGKSRLEKIANDKIREIMKLETTIVEDIQRRQLIWYGHVERMEDTRIPKQVKLSNGWEWSGMAHRKEEDPGRHEAAE